MMTKFGRWGNVAANPTEQASERATTKQTALTVRWVFTGRFYQRQPDRQAGLKGSFRGVIAVGTPVARRSPHRSRRAVFPHRALHHHSLLMACREVDQL